MGLLKRYLEELLSGALVPDLEACLMQVTLEDPLGTRVLIRQELSVQQRVQQRVELLQAVYPAFSQYCEEGGRNPADYLEILWHFWLPLGQYLAEQRRSLARPLVQGILGGQGTGKTTLAQILTLILGQLGYKTLSLSLDDLYKTYDERCQLQQQDPRFRWRGPPGTHDLGLGIAVLDRLRQPIGEPVAVPRFDKSAHNGAGDRTPSESVTAIDIILFEGWFVGVRPLDPMAFDTAPAPITTDADRVFARDINTRLQDYLPLWERLDRLLVLHPTDYHLSQQWRKQAEHEMIASGKSGMSDRDIDAFVEYFWQALHPELFLPPLLRHPSWVDLVVEIQPDHSPRRVYQVCDRQSGA